MPRELAISYAVWVDARFHLAVLRTYDAAVSRVHVAGITLREQAMLTECREFDSAHLARVGSALMHERRRDKPVLQATIAAIEHELQAQLFAEVKAKLLPSPEGTTPGRKHGKVAANDGGSAGAAADDT